MVSKNEYRKILAIDIDDRTAAKVRRISKRLERMHLPFDRMARRQKRMAQAMQPLADRYKRYGERMSKFGEAGLKLSAPAATAGVYGATKASGFEESFIRLRALAGEGSEELESVARKFGATTKYSSTQVSDAMQELARAGLDASGGIQSAVGPVLRLSQATDTELARSAEVLTDVMQQFQLDVKSTGKTKDTADSMAYAANNSSQSFEQLVDAIRPVGSIANTLGISEHNIMSAIASLANKGIKGAYSGTALAGGLSTLMGKPSAEARKIYRRRGIRRKMYTDKDGNIDFFKFLELLKEKKVSKGEFSQIFGKDNGKYLFAIKEMTNEMRAFSLKIKEDSKGTTERLAREFDTTVIAKLKNLSSAIEETLIKSFKDTGYLNEFKESVEWATKAVQVFTQSASPDDLKGYIKGGLGFAGTSFGLMAFGKLLAGPLFSAGAGMAGLFGAGAAATTTAGAAAVIAGLAAVAYGVYSLVDKFTDFSKSVDKSRLEDASPKYYDLDKAILENVYPTGIHRSGPYKNDYKPEYIKEMEALEKLRVEKIKKESQAYFSGSNLGLKPQSMQVDVNFNGVPRGTTTSVESSEGIQVRKTQRYMLGEIGG